MSSDASGSRPPVDRDRRARALARLDRERRREEFAWTAAERFEALEELLALAEMSAAASPERSAISAASRAQRLAWRRGR